MRMRRKIKRRNEKEEEEEDEEEEEEEEEEEVVRETVEAECINKEIARDYYTLYRTLKRLLNGLK